MRGLRTNGSQVLFLEASHGKEPIAHGANIRFALVFAYFRDSSSWAAATDTHRDWTRRRASGCRNGRAVLCRNTDTGPACERLYQLQRKPNGVDAARILRARRLLAFFGRPACSRGALQGVHSGGNRRDVYRPRMAKHTDECGPARISSNG